MTFFALPWWYDLVVWLIRGLIVSATPPYHRKNMGGSNPTELADPNVDQT